MSKIKIKQCLDIIEREGECVGLKHKNCPLKIFNYCSDLINKNSNDKKELIIEMANRYIEKKNKQKERSIPIDMWVARDKNKDLYLSLEKLERGETIWRSELCFKLDALLYPDVKWEDDEPLKIN